MKRNKRPRTIEPLAARAVANESADQVRGGIVAILIGLMRKPVATKSEISIETLEIAHEGLR